MRVFAESVLFIFAFLLQHPRYIPAFSSALAPISAPIFNSRSLI